MARRRFQTGSVKLETLKDGRQQWEGRYREDVTQADGTVRRALRKVVLGTKQELPSERMARRALQPYLDKANKAVVPVESNNPDSVSAYVPKAKALVSFETFVAKWIEEILVHSKYSHRETAKCHLRKWLLPAFGKTALGDVRAEAVQRFFNAMKGKASPKLIRNVRNTLASILRQAKAWEYIHHDALAGLILPRYEPTKKPAYKVEDVAKILAHSNGQGPVFYALAESGLRAGELAGLEVQDVDLAGLKITVRQAIWRGHSDAPKTKAAKRTFAISAKLAEMLARQIAGRKSGPVFSSRNGTPLDMKNIRNRALRSALKAAGVGYGDLHTFRHFNATAMDSLRVPGAVKRLRLGHSDGSITDSYTDAIEKDDQAAAEQLAALIAGTGESLFPSCTPEGNKMTSAHG